MTLAPGAAVFVLAHGLIFPLSTLYGQLFAQTRLAAQTYPEHDRDGIMTVVRAVFALPFVVVLPLWALAFSAGVPILTIYPVTLIFAALICVAVTISGALALHLAERSKPKA